MRIGIVQPTYLPWLPFFERMANADVFIYLDDVKYSKNSFHNRNSVKGPNGRALLTVPVLYSGHSEALIHEIQVDSTKGWRKSHWKSLEQWYSKAPFFKLYRDEIRSLYESGSDKLIDVVLPFIEFLKRELRIKTPCHLSSATPVEGGRNEKLVNLCKHFGGTQFIVKPGTEDYHPVSEFQPQGIELVPMKYASMGMEYPQSHGPFESGLSALDYLLNVGPVDFKTVIQNLPKEVPHG